MMEDSKMKELIMDYVEGNLTGELKGFVEKHIAKDDKWKREAKHLAEIHSLIDNSKDFQPAGSLHMNFNQMLEEEIAIQQNKEAKGVYWNSPKMWMQIAASITILIAGVWIGNSITTHNSKQEMLAMQKEIEETKRLVIASLQDQSASSRLNAVNVSHQVGRMDNDIINALVKTMNTDDNANVRLAAMEALSQFADEEKVRNELVRSLSIQDKPVVQIALINLMVQLKEQRAIEPMKRIIESDESIKSVKDEANYGVFKLS